MKVSANFYYYESSRRFGFWERSSRCNSNPIAPGGALRPGIIALKCYCNLCDRIIEVVTEIPAVKKRIYTTVTTTVQIRTLVN
jgi:hypothetical protein